MAGEEKIRLLTKRGAGVAQMSLVDRVVDYVTEEENEKLEVRQRKGRRAEENILAERGMQEMREALECIRIRLLDCRITVQFGQWFRFGPVLTQ